MKVMENQVRCCGVKKREVVTLPPSHFLCY
jgi:hypothetical protein